MSRRTCCAFGLGLIFTFPTAYAASPVATLPYGVTDFVENSANTVIYGTVPGQNSIVEINPSTLAATLISVGPYPTGLALSADGMRLYVADNGANIISVLNTQNNTLLTPITLSGQTPLDVQVGSNNRLWVLNGVQNQFSSVVQIDATTGASTGAGLPAGTFIYGGRIRTSPDGSTLYYGDYGTSPSYEYQFNVSGTAPTTTFSASLGYNGEDVTLSRDGRLVAFGEGGNATNNIFRTSDDAVLGAIGSGETIAFSPDDAVAYASNQFQGGIYVTSLSNYVQTGTINTVGSPQELFVDGSAKYLFSDEVGNTRVYATGRVAVPEPAGAVVLATASLATLRRRRRSH